MDPINTLLLLAAIWTFAVAPLVFLTAVLKFMDIMRRTKDDKPW